MPTGSRSGVPDGGKHNKKDRITRTARASEKMGQSRRKGQPKPSSLSLDQGRIFAVLQKTRESELRACGRDWGRETVEKESRTPFKENRKFGRYYHLDKNLL